MTVLFALVGAVVAAAVAILAAAEAVLRLWAWFRKTYLVEEIRRQDFLDPAYHPYINWTDAWDQPMFRYVPAGFRVFNTANPVPQVVNNRLGFRTVELDAPVDEEAFRVVVMGGSAAWGFGASCNATTIAGALERLLNDGPLPEGRRHAVVYNLAQVNQTQTQDLILAIQYLPRLRPHVVVHYNGWNELAASITMDERLLADYDLFPMNELVGWEPIATGDNPARTLREALRLWGRRRSRLLEALWKAPARIQFHRSVADNVTLVSPLFARNIERFDVLARGLGFRYFNFLQPNLYRKRFLTPAEAKAIELYDVHRPMMGGKGNGDFLRSSDLYAGVMAQVAGTEAEGRVINLGDIFLDDPEARFFSLVHCRDEGYAAIAAAIHDVLCRPVEGRAETEATIRCEN
ncbi:MAG: hypothetical protein AB1918_13765 [Pseudomonadota bacterium]